MRSRRSTYDVGADISEMDPWKDDRCRDFIVLNTIQRLRAYHLPPEAPMPDVEPLNALRSRNLPMLPRAQPDWRPCMGESRLTKSERRRRATQQGEAVPEAVASSGSSSSSSEADDDALTRLDAAHCSMERARTIFFGPQSFTSSTSPRQLLYSPHVPVTPTPSVSHAPMHGTPISKPDGRPGTDELLESFMMQNSTPLRPVVRTDDATTPLAQHGTMPSDEYPSPSPLHHVEAAQQAGDAGTLSGRAAAALDSGRFSCEVVDALLAYYQSLLTRGVVLDKLNHKDLGFAWWVVGRNMDTSVLEQQHGPLRREALLITIRNFYYSLLSSNRKRGDAAKVKGDEAATADGTVIGEEVKASGEQEHRREGGRRSRDEAKAEEPADEEDTNAPAPRRPRRAALEKAKTAFVKSREVDTLKRAPVAKGAEGDTAGIVPVDSDAAERAVEDDGAEAVADKPSVSRYVKASDKRKAMEATWKPQRVSRRIAALVAASEEDSNALPPPPEEKPLKPVKAAPQQAAVPAVPKASASKTRARAKEPTAHADVAPPAPSPVSSPSLTQAKRPPSSGTAKTRVPPTATTTTTTATTRVKVAVHGGETKSEAAGGGHQGRSVKKSSASSALPAKVVEQVPAQTASPPSGLSMEPSLTGEQQQQQQQHAAPPTDTPVSKPACDCQPTRFQMAVQARVRKRMAAVSRAPNSYAFLLNSHPQGGAVDGAPPAKRGRPPHVAGAVDPALLPYVARHDAEDLEEMIRRRVKQEEDEKAQRSAAPLASLPSAVKQENGEEDHHLQDGESGVPHSLDRPSVPFQDLPYAQQCLLVWGSANLLHAHQQRRRALEERRWRKATSRVVTRRMAALAARGELQEILDEVSSPSTTTSSSDDSDSDAVSENDSEKRCSGDVHAADCPDDRYVPKRQHLDYWASFR